MKIKYIAVFCALSAVYVTAATRYVWQGSPSSGAPYTSWGSAAHDIQSAVSVCSDGDTVIVTNGTYLLSSMINVNDEITIESVNGRDVTIIDGQGSVRCIKLFSNIVDSEQIVLRGFYAPEW